jgi:hypothetical protein
MFALVVVLLILDETATHPTVLVPPAAIHGALCNTGG